MTNVPTDPVLAAVHLRIAELQRAGDAARTSRSVRRTTRVPWPQSIVAGLRETFVRTAPAPVPARPCTTC